jgi:hypothetical protein
MQEDSNTNFLLTLPREMNIIATASLTCQLTGNRRFSASVNLWDNALKIASSLSLTERKLFTLGCIDHSTPSPKYKMKSIAGTKTLPCSALQVFL